MIFFEDSDRILENENALLSMLGMNSAATKPRERWGGFSRRMR